MLLSSVCKKHESSLWRKGRIRRVAIGDLGEAGWLALQVFERFTGQRVIGSAPAQPI